MNKGMKLKHRENWVSKKQLLNKIKRLELENQYLRIINTTLINTQNPKDDLWKSYLKKLKKEMEQNQYGKTTKTLF